MKFDPKAFQKNADLYGNKAANLMELNTVATLLNKDKPGRYAVPSFFPIDNNAIRSFLAEYGVLERIDTLWQEFQQAQEGNLQELQSKAKEKLAELEKLIEQTFKTHFFAFSDEDTHKKFIAFLAMAVAKKILFMVRSTGKEDTKELANAGGNKSISAVQPKPELISVAIGQVLASYFSEKSMSQRIVAGDRTLFSDKQPFMPVLIQIMITGNEVVSGVLFTQEAEGHTAGVTQIQATHGHGEGVVNGLVPVDTYYVGKSGLIHPLIRPKNKRLIPSKDFTHLEFFPNGYAQAHNPCLDTETVRDLKYAADVIQQYYGMPMDVEFVVFDNVIYLVQARPIVSAKVVPSYIKKELMQLTAAENKISCFTIGAAGGAARIIDTDDAIIVADNIRVALEHFLKPGNKTKIKAVVINEIAPATSHEATTFRGAMIPVLYIKDISGVRDWITERKLPLIIDPQRGLIVYFESNAEMPTPSDALVINDWLVHPIPKKMSLFAEFFPSKIVFPKKEVSAQMQEALKNRATTDLIMVLSEGKPDEVTAAIYALLDRSYATVAKAEELQKRLAAQKMITYPALLPQLKNIYQNMQACAQEVINASGEPDRLQRLYPITFFEALLTQIPQKDLFINDYSFIALVKTEQQELHIAQRLQELKSGALKQNIVQYAKAGNYALTSATKKQWEQFLQQLPSIADATMQREFSQLMYTIAQLNLLPLWINASFMEASRASNGKAPIIVDLLLKEYTAAKNFMNTLQHYKELLDVFNPQLFGEAATFEKQWKFFTANILMHFLSDKFINDLAKQPELGKLAAIPVMQQLIDVFDTSIKAHEASTSYADESDKIKKFTLMLRFYFLLLSHWMHYEPIRDELNTIARKTQKEPLKYFINADGYLSSIKNLFSRVDNSINQLQPTPRCNVAAATLGSYTTWTRATGLAYNQNPHLEDIFSIIHQNLLMLLSLISKQTSLNKMELPVSLTKIMQEIENITFIGDIGPQKPSLLGISLEKSDYLMYKYNLPARNHSCAFQVSYQMALPHQIALSGQLLGEARQRWAEAKQVIDFVIRLMALPFKSPQIFADQGMLQFHWDIFKNPDIGVSLLELALNSAFIDENAFVSISRKIFTTILRTTQLSTDQLSTILADTLTETSSQLDKFIIAMIFCTPRENNRGRGIYLNKIKKKMDIIFQETEKAETFVNNIIMPHLPCLNQEEAESVITKMIERLPIRLSVYLISGIPFKPSRELLEEILDALNRGSLLPREEKGTIENLMFVAYSSLLDKKYIDPNVIWPRIKERLMSNQVNLSDLFLISKLLDMYSFNDDELILIFKELCKNPENFALEYFEELIGKLINADYLADEALRQCLRNNARTNWLKTLLGGSEQPLILKEPNI